MGRLLLPPATVPPLPRKRLLSRAASCGDGLASLVKVPKMLVFKKRKEEGARQKPAHSLQHLHEMTVSAALVVSPSPTVALPALTTLLQARLLRSS